MYFKNILIFYELYKFNEYLYIFIYLFFNKIYIFNEFIILYCLFLFMNYKYFINKLTLNLY